MFGNILTVSTAELRVFTVGSLVILAVVLWRWQGLIAATLSEEMAAAHGVKPRLEAQIYTLVLALAVAMGMQILGALLMGAFLIIPAMAARNFASSPESMAVVASLIAAISGFLGLAAAYVFDLQTAPAMVVVAVIVFFISQLQKKRG